MSSCECEKCGTDLGYISRACFITKFHMPDMHYVCWNCYREWLDNGYEKIWRTFYCSDNFDLADKFMLDYLGKLG